MPSAGPRVPPLSSTLCRQRQACESPSLARRSPRQQEGDHTHALGLKWNARSTAPYEHEMRLDDVVYRSSEQAYMAAKARHFGDEATLALILRAKTAKRQKALGRAVRGYGDSCRRVHIDSR